MAVLKYKNKNGEYVAIPAGIPSNISVFNNDADYQTKEQVMELIAEGGGESGDFATMEEVETAISEALSAIGVAEEGTY